MTDKPYTGEDLALFVRSLGAGVAPAPAGCHRLAATLREYQRVLVEREKMTQAVGLATTCKPDMVVDASDPIGMMQQVCAEVVALRADALRWRAVRDDLCVDWIDPGAGKTPVYWRIDGNNYDYYRGPIPATVEDAADWLVHRATIDAARSGGEEKHD